MNTCIKGLQNKVFIISILVVFFLATGHISLAEGVSAVCSGLDVNYRTGPDITYNKVGQLQKNDKITVLGIKNNWYKFKKNDNFYYISKDFVTLTNNAYITGDNVNVRIKPSTDSEIIDVFDLGKEINVSSQSDNWYKVNYGGQAAWVFGEYVEVVNKNFSVEVAGTSKFDYVYVVSQQGINLREYPTVSSNKKLSLAFGAKLKVVTQINQEWLQVQTNDGDEGYVYQEFVDEKSLENTTPKVMSVTTENDSTLSSSIISYAKQFLGTKYVWGGESLTDGIDCSGFTQKVMAKFNISIPRTAKEQATVGKFVDRNSLSTCDLVFFDTLNKGYITHVGMYIGNGKFIHSSSSKNHTGIVITDLSNYSNAYRTARRVIS